jgi:hypothetical protein
MTTIDAGADQSWAQLATLGADEREPHMRERYDELAALPEEERRRQLRAMAVAEYALPDDQLRAFTLSRLRVWVTLAPDTAQRIAADYDAVMSDMPGTVAMRRVGMVQTLAKELPAEDEERLRALVPNIFAGQPHRLGAEPAAPAAAPPPAAESQPAHPQAPESRRRPWWAFWRK